MYTLKIENSRGDVLDFSNSGDYTVYKITGLAPPKATINKSANATTDGDKVNSTRLESRNIVIYAKLEKDVERSRINLYKFFSSKQKIRLYYANGTRNVYIDGIVEVPEIDLFKNPQVAQISIICADPYFRDLQQLKIDFSSIEPLFNFAFAIGEEGKAFSRYNTDKRKSIINPSDTDTTVTLSLFATGDVKNPVIYDITHGEAMHLNITLQQGDLLTINTHLNNKSISLQRDGTTTNALGYMRPDSDWFVLSAGDNVFSYECEEGADNLNITFSAPILYSGV